MSNESTDAKRQAGKASAAANLARFEHEVDPDGVLHPTVRRARARKARDIHMQRIAKEAGKRHTQRAAERAAQRAAEPTKAEPTTIAEAVLALDEVL